MEYDDPSSSMDTSAALSVILTYLVSRWLVVVPFGGVRHGQTDRQTDKQTNRQTDRQDRQAGRQTVSMSDSLSAVCVTYLLVSQSRVWKS